MPKNKRKSNLNFRQTKSSRSADKSNTAYNLSNRLGSYFKKRGSTNQQINKSTNYQINKILLVDWII